MSISEELWFKFNAQSISDEKTYLFTATATYKGASVNFGLIIDCDKPVTGINLVFTDSSYAYNDTAKVGYQFNEAISGYCVRGEVKSGKLRI